MDRGNSPTRSEASKKALAQHLMAQGAVRAALRLNPELRSSSSISALADDARNVFSVPESLISVVADAESSVAFCDAMRRAIDGKASLALDVEWRPDFGQTNNAPTLIQIAEAGGSVWLLDLQSPLVGPELLLSVDAVLESDSVLILGYGLQTDLNKLRLLPPASGARCFECVRHAIDLRAGCEGDLGLSKCLERLCGLQLDKAAQCSDWQQRPLKPAQLAYAAADAASLHVIHAAMVRASTPLRPILVRGAVIDQHQAVSCRETTETRVEAAATQSARHAAAHAGEALRATALASVRAAAAAASKPHSSLVHVCAVQTHGEAARPEGRGSCGPCSECMHMPINTICMVAGGEAGESGNILVLTPAEMRLDCRWLANCLGLPRNRLRLATRAECVERFRAAPGEIPPVPLVPSTRVLAVASLAAPNVTALLASAGDGAWQLCIGRPQQTLCHVCGSGFEWLPDIAHATRSLDDAIDQVSAR